MLGHQQKISASHIRGIACFKQPSTTHFFNAGRRFPQPQIRALSLLRKILTRQMKEIAQLARCAAEQHTEKVPGGVTECISCHKLSKEESSNLKKKDKKGIVR